MTEKRRRPWYQFSLRTLFVAVFLLTLPLSWLRFERCREQRAIVEIEALGGSVVYYYPPSDWRDSKHLPEPLRDFLFSGVYQAGFFPQTIDDNGLRHLRVLDDLRILTVADNRITDAGARHLRGLTELIYLCLSGTEIGDTGLEHLREMANLTNLQLARTAVTDAGLEHLSGLTNLNSVDLNGTQVTAKGVEKLREALPNCRVHH